MRAKHQGCQVLISGLPGMGKSYFVKQTLIKEFQKSKPVIIFDEQEEYAGAWAKDTRPGWIKCKGAAGFSNEIFSNGLIKGKVYVIITEKINDYKKPLELFERMRKPITLIIDEAHQVYKKFKETALIVENICRTGRKYGIDLYVISQRPYDVPPDIRDVIKGAISFRLRSKRDIEVYEKDLGFPEAGVLRDIKPREYVIMGEFPSHIESNLSAINKNERKKGY